VYGAEPRDVVASFKQRCERATFKGCPFVKDDHY
jgi:hypothetical protein